VEFKTKLVGTSFKNRQSNLGKVEPSNILFWKHEAENIHDTNAILVFSDQSRTHELGHLSRKVAARFIELIGKGKTPIIVCKELTGGKWPKKQGINIRIVY
jgi:hypothetical protein